MLGIFKKDGKYCLIRLTLAYKLRYLVSIFTQIALKLRPMFVSKRSNAKNLNTICSLLTTTTTRFDCLTKTILLFNNYFPFGRRKKNRIEPLVKRQHSLACKYTRQHLWFECCTNALFCRLKCYFLYSFHFSNVKKINRCRFCQ